MNSKKCCDYERLSLFEVQAIFEMRAGGQAVRSIGKVVNRSTGTVWKVLIKYRHPFPKVWLKMTVLEKAKHAYDHMRKNRARSGNHGHLRDQDVRAYVIHKLVDEQWSPEEIAGKLKLNLPGRRVCTKTIYNFIKHERSDLTEYLRERGKPRRQRVSHRRGRFKQAAPEKRSIHERPVEVAERQETGHWEGDTIITKKKGSKAILTLRERVTRKRFFYLIPNLQAETVLGVLRAFLETIPAAYRRSITFDNGGEFGISELSKLEVLYPGLKLYYCDPYAAWQRGSVENANKEFRWYFPKGTDFGTVTREEVAHIAAKLNRRPMKCLKFNCAEEAFSAPEQLAA